MHQPPGYPAPNSSGKVCCLRKTLYGLKQSGRRWYQKLVQILVGKLGVIAVHVDDCTIASTAISLIEQTKTQIRQHVEISDLGEHRSIPEVLHRDHRSPFQPRRRPHRIYPHGNEYPVLLHAKPYVGLPRNAPRHCVRGYHPLAFFKGSGGGSFYPSAEETGISWAMLILMGVWRKTDGRSPGMRSC